ncbi:MAG: A/G-specific adenine glycosylase [Lachnospiraceae bacterium]|nr:A/G-specific adenine glycosylase [Lachnospiraceae bacterium]
MLRDAAPLLTEWFARKGRPLPWRGTKDPYRILVSETMLQQTRIETVLRYFDRFTARFPDLKSLAESDEEEVLKLWEGLGYYSRARNLKKAAERCVVEYGGRLPQTAAELKKLPGVGEYTAGAVASLAFGEAVPAVDGNVLRILARFFADERDVTEPAVKKEAAALLKEVLSGLPGPGLFNEALMELGEVCCVPNGRPFCRGCPWKEACLAVRRGLEEDLPLRGAPKPRRIEKKTVLLLGCGGKTALEKRPEKGLLAGLYGFPLLDGWLERADIRAFLESYGAGRAPIREAGEAVHIFTHVEWHMKAFRIETETPLPGYRYAAREDLKDRFALPSAFKYFAEAAFAAEKN